MSVLLDNVTVSYQRRPAVHHVSGRFCAGIATAIVGPNGAGKSTLLKAIAGLLPVDSGQITRDEGLASMAYLPQKSEMDLTLPMTVYELVAMGVWAQVGAWRGVGQRHQEKIHHALRRVGMHEFVARPIAALSMGQLQRVLFARIIVQDAPLILLDEPLNAVDANTTQVLLEVMAQWQREGRTVVAVLHDDAQVLRYFQEVLLLAHEVVAWGESAQVLTSAHWAQAQERCAHWFSEAEICAVHDLGAPIQSPVVHAHCAHHTHEQTGEGVAVNQTRHSHAKQEV